MNVEKIIEDVERLRDGQEAEQLATYVGNYTIDRLTDQDRERLNLEGPDNQLLGYEKAGQLPVERLRELFEADDYGPAWQSFNSEQTEYYEQDEGRIEAYNTVLSLLRGDPPLTDSICMCGHWYGEHNAFMCAAPDCPCRAFTQDLEASTPEAIAGRGGDPERWPEHVKRYFAEQETEPKDWLAEIAAMLSGKEWSPDTLEELAALLTAQGYTIEEPA